MTDEAAPHDTPAPIAFGPRYAHSEVFKALFREGMSLVEETAAYLDSDGRTESRALPRAASLSYATESMRLTTRLMQIASWLLLQRAVNEGDMTLEQAGAEKTRVRLRGGVASRSAAFDALPERLRGLIERSARLQERVERLDEAIYRPGHDLPPADNPVLSQLGRLADAFARP
ncbi:DUF1465 family protein [Prosthecomicrobium pneumaticum]|uniref:Regulator of CtrA degradation n=1 Tax=Prosthecomicrobium pneumaticum TaxID=81895 RepID=A0A7W9CVX0_9HYPH|nr:DUF1465 family protein [Prosthecomicrobium pneumaticum]MBB5752634.1 regulator of CtrA degradation [Prosthecomicrobium pneumaticum]